MFWTYLAILGGTVLQVVLIAILSELLPLCSHGGRSLYEVVFCMQIVGVVGVVDLLNVIQKAFERLFITILIEHGRKSLVELVECLDTREDVVGTSKTLAHLVAHLYFLKTSVKDTRMGGDEFLRLVACQDIDVELRSLLAEETLHHLIELASEFRFNLLPLLIAHEQNGIGYVHALRYLLESRV